MAALKPLDLFKAPLSGVNLIEASAGTGKTYAITGLYLRLVLEAGRRVDQILVVTFTKAATEELRDRIRRRLVQARRALLQGSSADDFCQQLLAKTLDREQALRRLENAVRGFDEAAIFTIHGFCQRMLADGAFESGMPFETELLPEVRELLQEIVEDFWRREFYDATPLLVNYLLEQNYSPEIWLRDIKPYVGKTYLKLAGPEDSPDLAAAEKAFTQAYALVRERWSAGQGEVQELLLDTAALNANKYRKSSIPGWFELMDEYLQPETPNLKWFRQFEKFTARYLNAAVKKGQRPPRHEFFNACDALASAYERLASYYQWQLRALRVRLLEFCNQELEIRKRREQLQSYDDLLTHLHRALQDERGKRLAKAIHKRYTAALIDEFQDTDPVQYDIFRRAYADTDCPVFIVGDPKQAIYSFRGADIFAYLQARENASQRYTLDLNWRSQPQLIRAVNAVFGNAPQPFLFEDIPFNPASPATADQESFHITDESRAPLQVWFLNGGDGAKPLTKGEANEQAARVTAVEIARLLKAGARGEAHIGERALAGGDIAVLVRNHRQGRLVREQLMAVGVPSVQQAQDNVFQSREAWELERLLLAVTEPGREALVRAALATDLFGVTGEALYRLGEDEHDWEQRLEAFHDYHQLWRERGFSTLFRTLLNREAVPQRLLGFRDGERRLTNLLHLGELLQAAASRQRNGMDGLARWLAEHRQSAVSEDEEHQLRLESDEHLVKIVTVHKSKGLEYPIVFCPFMWDSRQGADKDQTFSFHDPENGYQAILDLGSDQQEQHRSYAHSEALAESLRLLYVALTRAQHRCYLIWGKIRDAGQSAPAWLLHPPPAIGPDSDRQAATVERFQAMTEQALRQELEGIAAPTEQAMVVQDLGARDVPAAAVAYRPPEQPASRLAARHFPGPVRGEWRISSFTALTTHQGRPELPDYDGLSQRGESEATVTAARNIFTFPRGARAGSCLHLIFEQLDFTQRDPEQRAVLVENTLREHGFEVEWTSVIAEMVERVLATPLDAQDLRLGTVTAERRLNELEFYYPLAELTPGGLRRVLEAHGPAVGPFREQLDSLDFAYTRGYMKGFIDLVFEAGGRFYLVDYKSNWLGMEPEDYHPQRLEEAMARESYNLQYLIYTVALHRYLRLRLLDYDYERHFGGVFYLFLRGMDPTHPDNGVFRDRPEPTLVEALDSYLASGKVV